MPTITKVVVTYSDGSTQELDAAAVVAAATPTEAQVQAAADAAIQAAFTPPQG